MYVFMHVYIYIYIYKLNAGNHTERRSYTHVHIHACTKACTYMNITSHDTALTHLHMYMSSYTATYIYTHRHTYIDTPLTEKKWQRALFFEWPGDFLHNFGANRSVCGRISQMSFQLILVSNSLHSLDGLIYIYIYIYIYIAKCTAYIHMYTRKCVGCTI